QTIAHRPGRRTITVQIGEPAVIAERTGLTTIADFRLADVAAGGQGAPLVPIVHHALFASTAATRAIVNVGGIANATILPAGASADRIAASDCGPGNVLIDECVAVLSGGKRRMDRGGRMAAAGCVDERLVRRVLAAPFFRRRLPASTGREDFGRPTAVRLCKEAARRGIDDRSLIASVTMATARSIARSCRKLAGAAGFSELYLCGGGACNPTLRAMLAAELAGVHVGTTDELGVDPAFLEAQAFAMLGWMALEGRAGNVPAATGAAGPRVLGKIIPGRNYRRVLLAQS
ncbi:MAG: anhydro-N-acetylmuramic acid kinase, partial [Deltaproteobacteria bacterium]